MVKPSVHSDLEIGQEVFLSELDAAWYIDRLYKAEVRYVRVVRQGPDGHVSRRRMRADVLRAHHRAIARRRSEQDIQSEFGYRVRALRVERDFSQEELAPLAGMHWSALGHIEAGRRTASLQVISGLAVALDVAPSALLP